MVVNMETKVGRELEMEKERCFSAPTEETKGFNQLL